jgi:phage recombination protein Bet
VPPHRGLLYHDLARRFAVAMGQDPLAPRGDFRVPSKKSAGVYYEMVMVDGYAVHQGEDCLGARFRGPLSCWHSKDFSTRGEDMTSLVTTQPGALAEVREFSQQDIDTLKTTICRGASDPEMRLFIATARHTGLDPFLRQIHCVMRSVQEDGQWVKRMTIQIGIDGYRLIADRTGKYQGSSEAQWTYDGETWVDIPREGVIPLAARIAVYRKGVERDIIGFARWSANVQKTRTGEPNAIWTQRGPEQLAKCAEVQALRKAFPAEMAALPVHESYVEEDEPDLELPETQALPVLDAEVVDMKRPEQVAWEQTEAYKEAQAEVARVTALQQEAVQQSDLEAARDIYLANHEAAQEEATAPSPPPAPSPEQLRQQVKTLLEDCKQTWDAQAYIELGQELSIFMPGGEGRFALSKLEGERLPACIEYLRARRGELMPAS